METWIRDAFRLGFGKLNPVFKATGTIASAAVTQAHDRMFYVLADGLILYPGLEWQESSGGVSGLPKRYNGSSATLYYYDCPDLTGSTIESTCVHGTDWLEGFVTAAASITVLERLAQTSTSHGGQYAASMVRVYQQQLAEIEKGLAAQRAEFFQLMERMLQDRRMLGPRIRRDHAWSGFQSKGRTVNNLTGVP